MKTLIGAWLRSFARQADSSTVPNEPGLGSGPLQLAISEVRALSTRVRAYVLRAPDGVDLPIFEAGSHIAVPVRLPSGELGSRTYSLSSDPAARDHYELAVLREDSGRGGSRFIHSAYLAGMRLNCEPPRNSFALHDDDRPALLIAGGIGVTPLKGMAQVLARAGRRVKMHYCARSAEEAVYLAELTCLLGDRLHCHFSGNRLSAANMLAAAPPAAVAYVCGPAGLIESVNAAAVAAGWSAGRVRVERFAPFAFEGPSKPFDIVLRASGRRIRVGAGESALEALERSGVEVSSGCREGGCGACMVRAVGGDPDHRDAVLGPDERSNGAFALCVSRAHSPELVLEL